MAITLVTNPGVFRPVYNPIQWVVSSDNTGRCDFIYLCDVYVNGNFVIRLQSEPGESDYGYLRVERVLQDFLSFDFKHDLIGFSNNPNSYCEYYLEFREQYNTNYASTCVGGNTISSVLYTSPTSTAWNGALQYKENLDFSLNNYILNSSVSRFLNRTPVKLRIPIEADFVASFLQIYGTTPADTLEIKTYNSSFVLINTYYIDNDSSPIASSPHSSVGVGANNLNEYAASLSPAQVWIDDNVYFYTVQLLDNSSPRVAVSEVMIFEIDRRCTKFEKYRLWWFTKTGAFNSENFNLYSTRNLNTSQITYEKQLDVNYSEGDRGQSVISVDANEVYLFQTDSLRKEEAAYLEELYTSPEIYLSGSNTTIVTLVITGAIFDNGNVSFVLTIPPGITIETGTSFTYVVDDGSPIGMDNSGAGVITGINIITGYYETNVPATINAGAFISGYMVASVKDDIIIPMVRLTSTYADQSRIKTQNRPINYAIELTPSYKQNIQNF